MRRPGDLSNAVPVILAIVTCYKLDNLINTIMQFDVTRIICIRNNVRYLDKEQSYKYSTKEVTL